MNQKVNSVDPDQMAQMCWLIWICTVQQWITTIYMYPMDYRVNHMGTSVDPDPHLIWIYTVNIFFRNNPIKQKVNSEDPDQTALICRPVWI
jgi:hypothetical protein